MILVAPTEPPEMYEALERRGLVPLRDSLPEQLGADYVVEGQIGFVCVQRKAMPDLVASAGDGRLQRETSLLRDQAAGLLLIEGWVESAVIAMQHGGGWDHLAIRSLILSVACQEGLIPLQSRDMQDSANWLEAVNRWATKPAHRTLLTRPRPPRSARKGDAERDQQEWLLQGFPGIGPGLAAAIVDCFGCVPLAWTCTVEQLAGVPRMGPTTAKKAHDALGGQSEHNH